jgi:hypothetical protein
MSVAEWSTKGSLQGRQIVCCKVRGSDSRVAESGSLVVCYVVSIGKLLARTVVFSFRGPSSFTHLLRLLRLRPREPE